MGRLIPKLIVGIGINGAIEGMEGAMSKLGIFGNDGSFGSDRPKLITGNGIANDTDGISGASSNEGLFGRFGSLGKDTPKLIVGIGSAISGKLGTLQLLIYLS